MSGNLAEEKILNHPVPPTSWRGPASCSLWRLAQRSYIQPKWLKAGISIYMPLFSQLALAGSLQPAGSTASLAALEEAYPLFYLLQLNENDILFEKWRKCLKYVDYENDLHSYSMAIWENDSYNDLINAASHCLNVFLQYEETEEEENSALWKYIFFNMA